MNGVFIARVRFHVLCSGDFFGVAGWNYKKGKEEKEEKRGKEEGKEEERGGEGGEDWVI